MSPIRSHEYNTDVSPPLNYISLFFFFSGATYSNCQLTVNPVWLFLLPQPEVRAFCAFAIERQVTDTDCSFSCALLSHEEKGDLQHSEAEGWPWDAFTGSPHISFWFCKEKEVTVLGSALLSLPICTCVQPRKSLALWRILFLFAVS